MASIAIVDYRAGNLTSVKHAFAEIGHDSVITRDPSVIAGADRLVFPGVGAAGASMAALRDLDLIEPLRDFVAGGRPFLGICVGCQILLDNSLEDGTTPCLGVIPGSTGHFAAGPGVKVPHMGWNPVAYARSHPVFKGIPDGSPFYFVHSYYPLPASEKDVVARTQYGDTLFASVLARGNVVACQFHAEKSGKMGLRLLQNFCEWDGKP